MDTFWNKALKVGGVISVGFFVFWSFGTDIIAKFPIFQQNYAFILGGMILLFIFIVIGRLIKKDKDNITDSVTDIENSNIDIDLKDTNVTNSMNNIKNSKINIK